MKKKLLVLLTVALMVFVSACQSNQGASTGAGYPERTVELVVPFSAGGGSDVFARTVAKVIMDNQYVDQTISIINKTGGGGSLGYAYLAEKAGDPYYIAVVGSSFYSNYLIGNAPNNYTDFVPLAAVAEDSMGIFVRTESDIKDVQDIVDRAKASPSSISVGGTGGASLDAIAYYLFQDTAGVELAYVPFDGGGEAMTALLGGHVDIVFSNPSEALGQLEAEKTRMLAVGSTERLPGFEEVPTFQEFGLDIVLSQVRGFLITKDAPPEAVAYWEDVLKKVYDTEEFKTEYLEANAITPRYMASEEYLESFVETTELYTNLFDKLGILKNRVE